MLEYDRFVLDGLKKKLVSEGLFVERKEKVGVRKPWGGIYIPRDWNPKAKMPTVNILVNENQERIR